MDDVNMIIRGGYLVPSYDKKAILDGTIALSGSIIKDIGKYQEIKSCYPNAREIGGDQFLIIPGLINGHSHGRGLTTFQRGTIDNTLESWILGTQKQKPIPVYDDVSFSAARLLKSGVTTTMHNHIVRDQSQYEKEFYDALKAYNQSGMRVLFCPSIRNDNLFVYGNNSEFISGLPDHLRTFISKSSSNEGFSDKNFVKVIRDLYEKYHGPMCKIGFGPLAPQWCTQDLLLEVRKEANRLNIPIHIHTLESVFQKMYSLKFMNKTLIGYMNDIGFLGQGTTIGHCVWPTESDVHLLARTGTGVTHQPSANLRLRAGISPVAHMLQEGVRVGLGMDGTTINDNDDFIQEMKVCYLLQRLSSLEMDSPFLTARQIFKMGTENNAALVGYGRELGRLEPGFLADLVLLDYKKICYPYVDPTHDPIDTLLYRGLGQHVNTVIVHGKVVVSEGQILTLDEQATGDRLAESAAKPMKENEILRSKMMDELRKHIVKYYKNWINDLEFESYWHVHSRIDGLKRPCHSQIFRPD